eukprot:SAG22_NODE_164_length_16817_cov_61.573573_12_plen_63_part_00
MRSNDKIIFLGLIIMECYNFTSYIDDIHGLCGNDLDNVRKGQNYVRIVHTWPKQTKTGTVPV